MHNCVLTYSEITEVISGNLRGRWPPVQLDTIKTISLKKHFVCGLLNSSKGTM